MKAFTIDRETLKVIVDDLVNKVDNEIWRQRDYTRGLSDRVLRKLDQAVRLAIQEALK